MYALPCVQSVGDEAKLVALSCAGACAIILSTAPARAEDAADYSTPLRSQRRLVPPSGDTAALLPSASCIRHAASAAQRGEGDEVRVLQVCYKGYVSCPPGRLATTAWRRRRAPATGPAGSSRRRRRRTAPPPTPWPWGRRRRARRWGTPVRAMPPHRDRLRPRAARRGARG